MPEAAAMRACQAMLMAARGDMNAALGQVDVALGRHKQLAMPFEFARTLQATLAANIDADMRIGPAFLLPAVRSQLPLVMSLCHKAHGADREPVLRVGIQFNEFCGWLYQDSGNFDAAMSCTDTAQDFAAELNDPRVMSYVLMRKSNIASDAGQASRAFGLANAALVAPRRLTPRLRAVALRQKANAHALLGDYYEFTRARDAAHIEAATGMSQHDHDTAGYCTPSYVEMEAGAALVRLGRAAQAVSFLTPR